MNSLLVSSDSIMHLYLVIWSMYEVYIYMRWRWLLLTDTYTGLGRAAEVSDQRPTRFSDAPSPSPTFIFSPASLFNLLFYCSEAKKQMTINILPLTPHPLTFISIASKPASPRSYINSTPPYSKIKLLCIIQLRNQNIICFDICKLRWLEYRGNH